MPLFARLHLNPKVKKPLFPLRFHRIVSNAAETKYEPNQSGPEKGATATKSKHQDSVSRHTNFRVGTPHRVRPRSRQQFQKSTRGSNRIHGPRPSNARLLMNGRVFRLNDAVEHQLGIQFVGSRDGALVFKDSLGFGYTKAL